MPTACICPIKSLCRCEASNPPKRITAHRNGNVSQDPYTPWASVVKTTSLVDDILQDASNPESLAELKRVVDALYARASFAEFCKQAWHTIEQDTKFLWNWHHQLVCDVMQGMFEDWEKAKDDPDFIQRCTSAVFSLSPGSAKSKLVSTLFMCWVWTRRPGVKFICLSVNEDATLRDARASRDVIKSDWYQRSFTPEWSIKVDQDAVSNYANTAGGERLSRAQGSEIVGLRCDILTVDDPNNPKESESKKVRDEVNGLWDSNIFNRVNDVLRSLRFGVQQRTHAMDWTGHVLAQQGTWHPKTNPRGWLHVVIPAEFESSRRCVTPWGSDPRKVEGESVHPERWPLSWLKKERERLRDQYAGQMQQRPTLAEGGMVLNKWWNFFRLAKGVRPDVDDELLSTRPRPGGCSEAPALLLPAATHRVGWDLDKIVLSVDPANKRTDKGSRWACVMAGIKGGRRYILDVKAERGDYLQILEGIIVPMCRFWLPNEILIEGKAAGPVLLTAIQRMLWDGTLRDEQGRQLVVSLTEVSADAKGTKEDRLQAVLSYIKNGQVLLRHGAEWLPDFIEEFNLFPNGSTDDICDSLSQLLAESMVSGVSLPDW